MHPNNNPHTLMDQMIERAIPAVDKAMRTPGYDQDVINHAVATAAITIVLSEIADVVEEAHMLTFDGDTVGVRRVLSGVRVAVSNAKGKAMSDNGMPQPATMSLPEDFKNSVNEAMERKRKSDPLYHALLSQMSGWTPLTPEQAADLAYYAIEHDRNHRRAEAQVRRLQVVARAAQRVWEKSETEDEVWAYRDMIDAIEALQPGDLDT